MSEPLYIIEEVSDAHETARVQAQDARHRLNNAWLQTHWDEVLPQARGKFLAVAGQEAFIAQRLRKPGSGSIPPTQRTTEPLPSMSALKQDHAFMLVIGEQRSSATPFL